MNEFELEQEKTRTEVASYLHKLAEGLETGDKVTLIMGSESVTINPPENLHLKIETETNGSWLGGDSGQSIEIELGWDAGEIDTDEDLIIVNQPNPPRRGEDVRPVE